MISIVQNGYSMYCSEAMIICRIASRSKLGHSLEFYQKTPQLPSETCLRPRGSDTGNTLEGAELPPKCSEGN